ncbi:trypsin-like serine protease [Pedobacter steynii]|uniref:Peptidase S1 domain-containing protein n=1 Tax=Pedobacter steynii TaxID=430522 RepID=A0A1D7QN61_9SPHI|nr:trypsin-like serine protease [Pedobacter steynii]AOM80101.1 hypothetical protein BFS30_24820 [Pedobacter steynii]
MKKAILAFIAIGFIVLNSNKPCSAQQFWIVGGQEASEGQFPWIGDMRIPDGHFCGAALIHPRWAITAGHCVDTSVIPLAGTTIRFNSVNTINALNPGGGVEAEVKAFFPHQLFSLTTANPAGGYDIGLVLLKQPVTSITPISLPATSDMATVYQTGAPVKMAGWGVKDTFSGDISFNMKWCNTKVYDHNICDSLTTAIYNTSLSNNVFCAGYKAGEVQAGSAAGDSGGPVWIEQPGGGKKIIGVVSGGFDETTLQDEPGLFTKLAAYRPWIDSVMNANDPATSISQLSWNGEEIKVGSDGSNINLILGDLKTGNVMVRLYNIEGKIAYHVAIANPSFKSYLINTTGMPQGVYLLRISDKDGKSFTRKLVNATR